MLFIDVLMATCLDENEAQGPAVLIVTAKELQNLPHT